MSGSWRLPNGSCWRIATKAFANCSSPSQQCYRRKPEGISTNMLTRFIDWFWRDRQTGRIVIAQWPNLWLWIFAAASLVELITNAAGPIGIGARIVSTTSLLIWAGDELLRGANPWRRCLGIAVLIGLTIRIVLWFWR